MRFLASNLILDVGCGAVLGYFGRAFISSPLSTRFAGENSGFLRTNFEAAISMVASPDLHACTCHCLGQSLEKWMFEVFGNYSLLRIRKHSSLGSADHVEISSAMHSSTYGSISQVRSRESMLFLF